MDQLKIFHFYHHLQAKQKNGCIPTCCMRCKSLNIVEVVAIEDFYFDQILLERHKNKIYNL